MPENQTPVTKTEPGEAAGEFNFAKPETENPRIKKRSLKTKPAGLIKPSPSVIPAARELEREAPPLSAEEAIKTATAQPESAKVTPTVKTTTTTVAPPRTTPTTSAPVNSTPKTTTPTASTPSTTSAAPSPHGTRPATLYYSTNTRQAETPSPMKTIPTASTTSSSSSSATAVPTSVARPSTASASRPAPNVDYRANVERQSREQKSVGSILSYIVYAFIAIFVISAGLAGYGAKIIFDKLHDQSATVADLDQKYTAANKDLVAKLSATQDTLSAAQSQIDRQQDLIVKQQEAINQLLSAMTSNDAAIKQEHAARAQDTASLRARVKELEYRTTVEKY